MNRRFKTTIVIIMLAIAGLLSLSACGGQSESAKLQQQGQQDTVDAFSKQSAAVPYPKDALTNSLERKNLSERLVRTNKPDSLGYVYLMSFGKVIGYYAVKGKVSSTQSQMTTDQLVVRTCENAECSFDTVTAPGDDGSYGANEDGIFFFTTSGQMVTTNLDYVWSDNPLPIEVPLLEK